MLTRRGKTTSLPQMLPTAHLPRQIRAELSLRCFLSLGKSLLHVVLKSWGGGELLAWQFTMQALFYDKAIMHANETILIRIINRLSYLNTNYQPVVLQSHPLISQASALVF